MHLHFESAYTNNIYRRMENVNTKKKSSNLWFQSMLQESNFYLSYSERNMI